MGSVKKSVNVFLLAIFMMLALGMVFGFAGLLPKGFFTETAIIVLFPYYLVKSRILLN